jgi:hypothetical protein
MKRKQGLIIVLLFLCLIGMGAGLDTTVVADISTEKVVPPVNDNVASTEPLKSKEFRPELGAGLGYYQFLGDVRTDSRSHFAGSIVYSFYAARRVTDWLDFGLRYSTGVMVGSENGPERYLNFETIIHEGSCYLAYDFSNFVGDSKILKPYLSVGFSFFEFNNKGDLYDANGNEYNYWSDGSIRTASETSNQAANAVQIRRDYVYETDLRKADMDGFGRYSQVGFGIPMGLEFELNVTSRFSFRIGTVYTLSFTDLLDNVTENSSGTRAGTKGGDHFLQNKISVHYDMFDKLRKVEIEDFEFVDYLALDIEDDDKDKVINEFDLCPYTLKDIVVDEKGCALDIDKDGIVDFLDKDDVSDKNVNVNEHGIALTDDDYLYWYMKYIDSLDVPREVLERIAGERQRSVTYRVFLMDYEEGELISDDDLGGFSDEDDLKVFTDKNKRTIYTSGEYSSLGKAEERKNELIESGLKNAQVVVYDDNEMIVADEWNKLADRQIQDRFKADFQKIKKLDGMYAVKLGETYRGASSLDKERYYKLKEVFVLEGDRDKYEYVVGPFIDVVTAGQNVQDYLDKGFLNSTMVKISNGRVVAPEKPTDQDSQPLSDNELGDFASLKKLDGKLVIKVGTINKKTSFEEKQKLKNEKDLISINNSDRSIDFVYATGYDTKADARKKKQVFEELGYTNPQTVKVFVEERELKPVSEESLNNMFTISLGSYKKGVPSQEIDRILSVIDAEQIEGDNPKTSNYVVGNYSRKEDAKERILQLAFQGIDNRLIKFEDGQVTPELNSSMFSEEEQQIIEASKSGGGLRTNEAVFRVQIGAFKKAVPAGEFKDIAVIAFETPKGVMKYLSQGVDTYRDAYIQKLKLKKLGFDSAYVVAHKDGKNIPLKDLVNDDEFKTVNKEFGTVEETYEGADLVYKVQVGAYKNFSTEHTKLRGYQNVEMEIYGDYKRVITGAFYTYPEAVEYKDKLVNKLGYRGAFVVAYAKGERLAPTHINPNIVKLGKGSKNVTSQKVPGLVIRVQVGLYRGVPPADIELMMVQLHEKLSKDTTSQGIVRYSAGEFDDPMAATAYKQVLRESGFKGAFLVAYYNGKRIDIKKAIEMGEKK